MPGINRTMTWEDIRIAASRPGTGMRSSYARTLLEHLAPLPWDKEFHEASPLPVLGVGATQVEVVRWPRFGVDNTSMLALVRGVAMSPLLLTDWDFIAWQIQVDGQAWPGFDRIIGPFGVFIYPKPVLIPILPDQVVRIVASNIGAAPIVLATAAVEGHYFPAVNDEQNGSGA